MANQDVVKHLLLLRHGKAELGLAISDFDRNLTEQGKHHTRLIADSLVRQQIYPDVIICSPALRAKETALIIAETIGFEHAQIEFVTEVYEASLTDLLTILQRCPLEHTTVLLVGHNPALESLVEYLVDNEELARREGIIMSPSTLVSLTTEQAWSNISLANSMLNSVISSASLVNKGLTY